MQKNILKTATLGTDRQSYESETNPFGELPTKESGEEELLRDAALYTFAKKVSFQPEATNVKFIPTALPETQSYLNKKAMYYFNNAANDFLRREFIDKTLQQNKIFPPSELPNLLDFAIKRIWSPEKILNIAGERGKWLIQFKKEWATYFGTIDEKEWETGSIEKRIRYLSQLRKTAPEKARSLFEEVIKEESWVNLVKLLSAFKENLDAEDEASLTQLLQHKRKEVREKAFQFLLQTLNSDFSKRMQERCESLINAERTGMGAVKLKVKLPQKLTKDMEGDLVSDKLQINGLGIKAARLVQLMQAISPDFWETHLSATPTELVAAAEKDTYSQALFQGWASGAIYHKNAVWAAALVESMVKETKRYEMVTDKARRLMIQLVEPEKMDELISQKFRSSKFLQVTNIGFRLMVDYDKKLSLETSVLFFKLLKNTFKERDNIKLYLPMPDMIFSEFKNMVHLFPVEVHSIVEKYWEEIDIAPIHREPIEDLMRQIQFKGEMDAAIAMNA